MNQRHERGKMGGWRLKNVVKTSLNVDKQVWFSILFQFTKNKNTNGKQTQREVSTTSKPPIYSSRIVVRTRTSVTA